MIKTGKNLYLADTAVLIGDVSVGENVTIMDSAVVRGDENPIYIGDNSNLQDNVTVHVNINYSAKIGKNVSVGHNAIVHGCVIEDNVLIGMGAIIMNNARIRSGSVVAAGTVITENFECEENSLIVGIPGSIKKIDKKYREMAYLNSLEYVKLNEEYRNGKYQRITGRDLNHE
ncbi:MAG: gamma carbonic anhydrase family protein [Ferroplasma sp.]